MAFPPEFLDEIRARVPLAGLIGRRVQLKKRGREHEGLCPFHKEKTPSFTVSEAKGFFHCFGCGAHGDAIGFVMRSEGLSFPEAVERLAAEAGLKVPETSPEARAAARRQADLLDVLEAAATWFEGQLAGSGGGGARGYLERRGVSPATAVAFRLGFAPDRRGVLRKALNAKGIGDSQLEQAGLIKRPEGGGDPRDYFFDRLIFPITDRRGRVIAFGGRALGDSKAKYINSPETPLFHKGRVLYNLSRARQAAHDTGELVVAEGYMDVIAMSQAGFPAAVAPLGTAVTEQQIAELWRLAEEPLICLDGDSAGRRAAFRSAETALAGLEPGKSLRYAFLPTGEDPDSLLTGHGPQALRRVLQGAVGLADLLWMMATEGGAPSTPERQAGLWRTLLQTVEKVRDPDVRNAYRTEMERRFEAAFGYNPRSGRRMARYRRRGAPGAGGPGRAGPGREAAGRLQAPGGLGVRQSPRTLGHRREQGIIATVINHPELLAEYAERLARLDLGDERLRRLVEALVDITAEAADLDTDALRGHLCEQGFSKVLESLLSLDVYRMNPSARPETPLVEVRAAWRHLLDLHGETEARQQVHLAVERLAQDPSEENLARLRAQQRSAEGGESRRTAFDTPAAAEPGKSD